MNEQELLIELKRIVQNYEILQGLKQIVNNYRFREEDHPRDKKGRFTEKGNNLIANIVEKSREQARNLTETEKNYLRIYTDDNAYTWINHYLRNGGILNKEDKKIVTSINKILKKTSLPEDMTLYRSVGETFTQNITGDYEIANLIRKPITEENLEKIKNAFIKRKPFADKGYVSTSFEHASFSASSPLAMIIKAPKGLNALAVDELSKFENEKEILINKGYKYKIYDVKIGTSPTGEKQYQLFTEIVS